MKDTACIIVQYGPGEPLEKTLDALKINCPEAEPIVIDNNLENIGYCAGVNRGIEKAVSAGAQYLWMLSPDAIPLPGADIAMIERFNLCPRCAVVGSMQLDPDDTDVIRHAGTLRAYPGGVHLGGRVSQGQAGTANRQKWVNSASMMIRASVVPAIGGFDERFFLFFGESDFCYRVRAAGFEVWYDPHSIVHHKVTTSRASVEIAEHDRKTFAHKWKCEENDPLWMLLDTITAAITK